ncbi:S10 family peptidase [Frateuria aurantia]|uniref:Carboxypeptidase C (Cathepsin A) n=1 Tax=Frateuria aurantia (strain ATCC 33424 / DSM 6220 / KCTC 2777 / LMG 1558 / NBRC 3245 / NCIMB 13370) TaxID=767434 RepID=H8L609_FRAAD|nr:peptidase S10 [Frateuria aurantia]AFC86752.1 carboxypeptidase C (cathepsin A) [Frateuria aurantia DSM 6220]
MKPGVLPLALGLALAAVTGSGWAAENHDAPKKAEANSPIPAERNVATRHVLHIDGGSLHYTAHAGTLLIHDDKGKAIGSMFYVAYTKDGIKDKSKRPVTFLYNGGPGSASLWMHMGSFGPKRVLTTNAGATPPPPYQLVDNPDSLLDVTDLVFIDAMGTGFSTPVGSGTDKDFWGVDQDATAFDKFITRYVTVNQRWNSPKFLYGESYGTTRSAALVDKLQNDGMAFNGVILMSSILNYGELLPGMDRESIGNLPSYAAIAAYHHKIALPAGGLPELLNQARAFADTEYTEALAKGDTLPAAQKAAIAAKLSALTGLSTTWLLEANLRIDPSRFQKELLRDRRLTIGRYDARFTGIDSDAAGETTETDPSDTGMSGAFTAAFNQYLTTDLNYHSDRSYLTMSNAIESWDWKHRAAGNGWKVPMPYVVSDLGEAMRSNPHLHVLSANGWYDLATPFHATEYDLAHLGLEPSQMGQLQYTYYPSGHMIYLNPQALHQLKHDLVGFYHQAAPTASKP